jgi:hypothetical protein
MINTINQPPASNTNQNNPPSSAINTPNISIAPQQMSNNSQPNNKTPKNNKKILISIIGLISFALIGFAAVFISQKQQKPEVSVPTAPESEPAAEVTTPTPGADCTLQFFIPSPTPTNTPAPNQCGYTPCTDDDSCENDLICLTTQDGKYCAVDFDNQDYTDRCINNPNSETCCTTPTPTKTPTNTPTSTPTDSPDDTPTPTNTPTSTPTDSPDDTPAPTNTPTSTPTDSPDNTPTPTDRSDEDPTPTNKPKPTNTPRPVITSPPKKELPEAGNNSISKSLQVGFGALGLGFLILLLL